VFDDIWAIARGLPRSTGRIDQKMTGSMTAAATAMQNGAANETVLLT